MDMTNTWPLYGLLIILIACVYSRYSLSINPNFDIIQLSLERLKVEHLFEKLPIVLNDSIVNPNEFVKTVFRYLYISKHQNACHGTSWITSKARYLICFSELDNQSVYIAHPLEQKKTPDSPKYVEVLVNKNKCVIIPYLWGYKIPEGNRFTMFELNDILCFLARTII